MAECNKKPLLIIVGPTASGKTSLSIELAKQYDGEIISADSMQIYKGMDIATAKPSADELRAVPHHLISVLQNNESFNVAQYQALAAACIEDITARKKLPILVGGTGLYVSAIADNTDFGEIKTDDELRTLLLQRAKAEGGKVLLNELKQFDPVLADTLHPNNTGRIIRAIEVYKTTGTTLSEFQALSKLRPSPYNICMLGLTFRDRGHLYERINDRVDQMLEDGLLNEVLSLTQKGLSKTAYQAIGYKELYEYCSGNSTLETAIENLKKQTRHYAKRQLTWFRRDERINWIYNEDNNIINRAKEIMEKRGIPCYNRMMEE